MLLACGVLGGLCRPLNFTCWDQSLLPPWNKECLKRPRPCFFVLTKHASCAAASLSQQALCRRCTLGHTPTLPLTPSHPHPPSDTLTPPHPPSLPLTLSPPQILPFLEAAVEARAEIAPALAGNRDLLYLDVALENSIRGAAERGVGSAGACCCCCSVCVCWGSGVGGWGQEGLRRVGT